MTSIKGSVENYVLSVLKDFGISHTKDLVYIKPTVMRMVPAAPAKKGRRKYTSLTIEFGFDPTIFREPENVHAFMTEGSGFIMMHTFDPQCLSADTLRMVQKTQGTPQRYLEPYPELLALWDEFIPKWKEAYQRALDQAEKQKEDTPDEQ